MPEPVGQFFIIGAQRCGTTMLYELLDSIEGVEMARPARPEPKWFLDPRADELSVDQYTARFYPGGSPRWRGEKSTSYIEHPVVAERIRSVFPNAEIVVALRDPIDRAVSNYDFSVQHGIETRPITEALAPDSIGSMTHDLTRFSVSPYAYLERGRYVDHLDPWLSAFGPDHVFFVLFEEICSGDARSLLAAKLGLRIPTSIVDTRPVNPSSNRSVLPVGLRRELADFFREPTLALESRIGRSLDHWIVPPHTEVTDVDH
jgi:hypothetical protein